MKAVQVDYARDERLSVIAKDLLDGYYLQEGEGYQDAFARAAVAFSAGDAELAQGIYDDVSKGWAMFSSPILSNAPKGHWEGTKWVGEKVKALPISCFLGYVPDTVEGLIEHQAELAWLSVKGGGVGGHWSDVRSASDKSVGAIPHIRIADSAVEGFRQGKTRKGSYAAYLDVSSPDFLEFLQIRQPTGGDFSRKCFNIHHAVNIPDEFMQAVQDDAIWEFKCKHSGRVADSMPARAVWEAIIESRFKTGEPYINFIDTVNKSLPDAQRDAGLKVHGSNLCNEIHLPTSAERTAVCCLSSVNVEKFEEWRHDPEFIGRWIRFLDNVLEYFIQNAPPEMHKAVFSATQERALGLGQMGSHSLFQSRGIAFDSPEALRLTNQVAFFIHKHAKAESLLLGAERGEAPDMKGTGYRNSHVLAVAPNANSGHICDTSPSVEPIRSNAYTQRSRAGSHLIKNRHLVQVLQAHGKDTDAVWQQIILARGSVQSLDFLTEQEREVFKTAFELDMHWQVNHAADRQKFICQGQSINLYFPYGSDKSYVNSVHLAAYTRGLKGLYYLRTTAGIQADSVSNKVQRVALRDFMQDDDECVACQG